MKNCKYTSKLRLQMVFMNDIDIHQLNLGPFGSVKHLVENPFKKCVFCTSWTINA